MIFRVTITLIAITISLSAHPARAAQDQTCSKAYEAAADDYWRIVSDIVQFKTLFDNYNTLCQKHYPKEIEKLQPDADTLRRQVAQDMKNVAPAMKEIFDTEIKSSVSKTCANENITRATIQRSFLHEVKMREQTLATRMKKSASTLRDPDESIKLCRDLAAFAPIIRKKLGPDLAMPLLTMSEMNRQYMVKDSKKLKNAFSVYRDTVLNLNAKDKP